MDRKDVVALFGSYREATAALGLHSKGTIFQWPDPITLRQRREVVGAALHLEIITCTRARQILNDEPDWTA